MHDEAGFLAAIRLTPADDVARLVFADWLDEQDLPSCKTKAQFIRFELQMVTDPHAHCPHLANQLLHLAAPLDPDWLAIVSSPTIEGCVTALDRGCPSVWSRLSPTRDTSARECPQCQQTVRYARTRDEILDYARRGYRTAASPALPPVVYRFRVPGWGVELTREPLIDRQRLPRDRDERCPDRQELPDALRERAVDEIRWGPEPKPKFPPRRPKGRGRNRNIQREDWEGEE